MITLTTEQAQQIEKALEDIVRVFQFETGTPVEALAVIRAARAHETCNWIQDDDDGNWATDCGGIFVIIDGTPRDNEMKFCPYCSNRITEHPYMENENDGT